MLFSYFGRIDACVLWAKWWSGTTKPVVIPHYQKLHKPSKRHTGWPITWWPRRQTSPLSSVVYLYLFFFLCDDDWLLKVRNMATKCCMFIWKKKCLTFRVKHHGSIVMFFNIWGLKRKSMAVSSSTKNSSLSGWKSVETILVAISCSHLGIFWLCVIRLFIRGFIVLTVPNVLLQKGCSEIARSVLKMETI